MVESIVMLVCIGGLAALYIVLRVRKSFKSTECGSCCSSCKEDCKK